MTPEREKELRGLQSLPHFACYRADLKDVFAALDAARQQLAAVTQERAAALADNAALCRELQRLDLNGELDDEEFDVIVSLVQLKNPGAALLAELDAARKWLDEIGVPPCGGNIEYRVHWLQIELQMQGVRVSSS